MSAFDETDSLLLEVAATTASAYGMTAEQLLQHIAIGDIPHPSAAFFECGATDPRDDSRWCRLNAGHRGHHLPWRFQSDYPEDARALDDSCKPFLADFLTSSD